jgi:L-fucose mutarotase
MDPDAGQAAPQVHTALTELLEPGTPVDHLTRNEFYEAARSDRLALVIASGDERWYANVLLTVGAVENPPTP